MAKRQSIAEQSLTLTGFFEAEVLVWLLLRQWKHPRADDEEHRSALLEVAAEMLQVSIRGERLCEELAPKQMNLIAALWYAEATFVEDDTGITEKEQKGRASWLKAVRRALPSCFCDPDLLI